MCKVKHVGVENRIGNFARATFATIALATPFVSDFKIGQAENDGYESTAYFSSYYCRQVPGYKIFDGGGFCGVGADGTRPIEGLSAACGNKYNLGDSIYFNLGSEEKMVTCTDRGRLRFDQVELFTETNEGTQFLSDVHGFPTRIPVYVDPIR